MATFGVLSSKIYHNYMGFNTLYTTKQLCINMNIEASLYQFEFSNVWFKLLMCNFNIRNLKT